MTAKQVDDQFHTLSHVAFESDCVVASCAGGCIFTWGRPEGDMDAGEGVGDGEKGISEFRDPFVS